MFEQVLTVDNTGAGLRKASRYLSDATQAYDNNKKNKFLKCLQKAYAHLPQTQLGTRIAAEIIESYLQAGAYEQVIATAEQIERQGYYMSSDSPAENFDLFRIFVNKAEAHEALCEPTQARLAREKALDYQLETTDAVDVEMLQLLSK